MKPDVNSVEVHLLDGWLVVGSIRPKITRSYQTIDDLSAHEFYIFFHAMNQGAIRGMIYTHKYFIILQSQA